MREDPQLDLGFPRPLQAAEVAKAHERKPRALSYRRLRWSEIAPREWEDHPVYEVLTWQEAYAREVGIPRSGPI